MGVYQFQTSGGVTITYSMRMTQSPSGSGPQIFMDDTNKNAMCQISPSDTASMTNFQNSLSQALITEAANPGLGIAPRTVDQAFADAWAANSAPRILGNCGNALNDEGPDTSVTMAFDGTELNSAAEVQVTDASGTVVSQTNDFTAGD